MVVLLSMSWRRLKSVVRRLWAELPEGAVGDTFFAMTLEISTPALLFPAISLLFLSYTNRFLHLAALIRQLYRDWLDKKDDRVLAQIANLRRRLMILSRGRNCLKWKLKVHVSSTHAMDSMRSFVIPCSGM